MFSNKYIYIYSTILVVVVAAVLAFAAMTLQPFQDRNVEIEKYQDLLTAVNEPSTTKDAEALYKQYFVEELGINTDGEIVSSYKNGKLEGSVRPFDIDLKAQQKIQKDGGKGVFPLYIYEKEGKRAYVIPMLGAGLWGPVWGNMALSEDFSTVLGTTFGHKGETPGLGAEISLPAFQSQFINKRIFDETGSFKPVAVVKNADKSSAFQVDAISGGTITSTGVSNMISSDLNYYQAYIKKVKATVNE